MKARFSRSERIKPVADPAPVPAPVPAAPKEKTAAPVLKSRFARPEAPKTLMNPPVNAVGPYTMDREFYSNKDGSWRGSQCFMVKDPCDELVTALTVLPMHDIGNQDHDLRSKIKIDGSQFKKTGITVTDRFDGVDYKLQLYRSKRAWVLVHVRFATPDTMLGYQDTLLTEDDTFMVKGWYSPPDPHREMMAVTTDDEASAVYKELIKRDPNIAARS